MSWKLVIFALFVVCVAGISALAGALAGGIAVYQALRYDRETPVALPASTVQAPSVNESGQSLQVDMSEVESSITRTSAPKKFKNLREVLV